MKISIIETKTVPTINVKIQSKDITFHSKYDPLKEASIWCQNEAININKNEDIIVVGLGAGYHLTQLANTFPNKKITAIEFNQDFFHWFTKSKFHTLFKNHPTITILNFNDLSSVKKKTIFTSIGPSNLFIHKSGMDILPDEYFGIKEALTDLKNQKSSLIMQIDNLHENFKNNNKLKDLSISSLKNTYLNKPMILVSAGPSLDKQLKLLAKISKKDSFIIGAVGTAIKPLLRAAIIPDFFVIIDPNETTMTQLTEVELPKTPLFYLSTAYHDTILLHKGPRFIMYQHGYYAAEKVALDKTEPLIQSGGSVATALLDLMVYLGGQQIALVGQDLAFTEGKTHADATHEQRNINSSHKLIKVLDYEQTSVIYTGNNLNLYRKWLERYASRHDQLNLYNCTEGGAYIKNWRHIPFEQFYNTYK